MVTRKFCKVIIRNSLERSLGTILLQFEREVMEQAICKSWQPQEEEEERQIILSEFSGERQEAAWSDVILQRQ